MTKDEELKEAEDWFCNLSDRDDRLIPELLLAYHHHRLDTAWVRFADKPHEKSGTYNVNVSGFGICDGVHALYFNEPNKLWVNPNFNDKRVKSILHDYVVDWQPLPKPPKETK